MEKWKMKQLEHGRIHQVKSLSVLHSAGASHPLSVPRQVSISEPFRRRAHSQKVITGHEASQDLFFACLSLVVLLLFAVADVALRS